MNLFSSYCFDIDAIILVVIVVGVDVVAFNLLE